MVVGVVVAVVAVAAPRLVFMVSFSNLHPVFHVTDANTPMTTTKVRRAFEGGEMTPNAAPPSWETHLLLVPTPPDSNRLVSRQSVYSLSHAQLPFHFSGSV